MATSTPVNRLAESEDKSLKLDFSVVIPTYQGRDRIPQVLGALKQQTGQENIRWEIIVVDNNSTDGTADFIRNEQATWPHPFPLHYCLETQQGEGFARNRGVREAKGMLVGFLDDDNIPTPHWLQTAIAFATEHPQAGAFSGRIHGDLAAPPPEGFEKIAAFLAIRDRGSQPHLFQPEKLQLPPSAGLVVQRQAWLEAMPDTPLLKGRAGSSMVGGEDYESLLHLHAQGWEIWYDPALEISHKIPAHRLEKAYLLSLAYGIGLTTCSLQVATKENWQIPAAIFRNFFGSARRVALHWIASRKILDRDLVAAFQMQLHRGSLESSFLAIRKLFSRQLSR